MMDVRLGLLLLVAAYFAGVSVGWLARSLVAALDDLEREFNASCDRIEARLKDRESK